MDSKAMASLRKKLEEARHQLSHEATRKANEARETGNEGAVDVADQALATYIRELMFSQSENETELLQMVNGALQRMEDGTYGQCLSCGREIGMKRLEAVPWTHLCIDCQTKAEQIDNDRNRLSA
jgi:DnaK suppressor protein